MSGIGLLIRWRLGAPVAMTIFVARFLYGYARAK
mgnify:CR=1 FL=1